MSGVILALAVLVTACRTSTATDERWVAETALEAGTKLGGCVGGDLVADWPGDEVAVVAGDGATHVVRHADGRFQSRVVASTAGEMIQCALGDVKAAHAGNELVIVGMQLGKEDDGGAGEAHVVWRDGDAWAVESLFVDTALIHGVAVGDVDPERPGDEVLLVGYSRLATLVHEEAGAWRAETIGQLPGPGKNVIAWNGGAVVACEDGSLVHLVRGPEGWTDRVLSKAAAGWARLGSAGEHLLAARDDGALVLFDAAGEPTVVHQETQKLRGAVLADLDPGVDGPELATAGYEMRATVLARSDGAWRAETVFEDDARFHHATSARIEALGPTLFVCGYSGRLTAIRRAR